MSTVQQRFWPWQLKRSKPAGAKVFLWFKRLFLLGMCVALPTGLIAAMPYATDFIVGMFGEPWGSLFATIVKGVLIVAVVLSGVAYATLAERRFAGLIQLRQGPNRVGWLGFLQPLADGLKFLFKEDVIPDNVHKALYITAPMIIMVPAITIFAIIPFGPGEAGANPYQLASLDIGILFVLALSSLGVYGIAIGGWASFSKWSLLGGLRASAQMISYEVSLGLAITGVLILTGSFDLVAIVNYQINTSPLFGFLPAWNAFTQGGGFVVFLVAAFAETNRLPFDMAEAEQELVGGYHTEYSAMKFAMFFLGEYANMIVASSLVTLLFLGGWHFPGLELLGLPAALNAAAQIFAFCFKVFLIIFLMIWARWTFPRFRYDQLMFLGWMILLPVAIGNLILTAVWVAFF